MKKFYLIASLAFFLLAQAAFAGNDSKRGSAGASELLINPWARSTGWNLANSGCVRGLESMNLNIAGLAYVRNMEFAVCSQRYLAGTGINVNSAAFATRLSPTGVLGLSVTSLNLGNDFIQTTYDLPQGTGNNFAPQFFNFAAGYSKTFSSRITGGIAIRGIYEGISNVSAFGFAIDAGIHYQAGKDNRFKFGVAIRNVGPKLTYEGSGLSFRGQRDQIYLSLQNKSAPGEMPALLNIGTSYDFHFPAQELRLTPAFNFTSNSYTSDNITPGAELSFKEMFMVRTSYNFRGKLTSFSQPTTDAYTGYAAGATINLPLADMFGAKSAAEMTGTSLGDVGSSGIAAPAKEKRQVDFAIDYSYRPTNPYSGTHAIGILVKL
jgi:hypothetical protein